MLCQFLPYINMNQPQVYICLLPLEILSHISPHSTPLVVTEQQAELPASQSKFPLAIYQYFAHGNVHISMLLSIHPTLSSCPLSISLFSVSKCLLLSCTQVHQHHFSIFHIYGLIHDICFLTYFSLYNRLQVHPPHQN